MHTRVCHELYTYFHREREFYSIHSTLYSLHLYTKISTTSRRTRKYYFRIPLL